MAGANAREPSERTPPRLGGVHAEIRTRVRRRRRHAASTDAWSEIDRAINPAFFRPALREDVEISDFVRRNGERYSIAKTQVGPGYMRLTGEERELLRLMDGSRTVKELVVGRFRTSGDFSLSVVTDLVDGLYREGFLKQRYDPIVERAVQARRRRRVPLPRWLQSFVATRRLDIPGSHRFFNAMYRYGGRFFFTKPVAVVMGITAVVGAVSFFVLVGRGKYQILGASAVASIGLLYLADYTSTFIHEAGHALATIHAKRRVNSAGFMLYLGFPAFFIETTDTWMSPRRNRMIASGAGPFVELFTAGTAAIIALALPVGAATAFLYRYAVISFMTIAQNLIPFLRLDGYYVLMDAMEEVNLRERSFEFVRADLSGKLRRREKLTRMERILTAYGVMAVVFTVLAVLLSALFWSRIFRQALKGAGGSGVIPLALITLLLFLILAPVIRGVIRLVRAGIRRVRPAMRLIRRATERSWRADALGLYRQLPLAGALEDEELGEIAAHVRLVGVPQGQAIVRQGERGEDFFVVRSGMFEVSRVEEDGTERVIRRIERGRSFGEIALLESAPRTATVRALEQAEVFALDKGTFDRVLAARLDVAEDVRAELLSAAEIRGLSPFKGLDDADAGRLLRGASWRTFRAGERIVKQGEEGDTFYVISSGQVDVIENRRKTNRLGAGDYFGEIALLTDEPRTATIRAATPVRVLELERKAFDRVLAKSFRKGKLRPSRSLARAWEH
ncbi:MAG TPA: cyclic nucleotide-binding domain-containing protein [Actinomycetota bacterium]|nr:cyclic nucleotide-binding domain-containing protein [Actinomycetota bacterium]